MVRGGQKIWRLKKLQLWLWKALAVKKGSRVDGGRGSQSWRPKEAFIWSGEAQELEDEAASNGQRRPTKLAWYCLFSKLALAMIGPSTGSGPS